MLFGSPEQHAANPPSTWRVVKVPTRGSKPIWQLQTAGGQVLEQAGTRKAAEAARTVSVAASLYAKEARWFAGELVAGWKPYQQVLAEREKRERWLAERRAARAAQEVMTLDELDETVKRRQASWRAGSGEPFPLREEILRDCGVTYLVEGGGPEVLGDDCHTQQFADRADAESEYARRVDAYRTAGWTLDPEEPWDSAIIASVWMKAGPSARHIRLLQLVPVR